MREKLNNRIKLQLDGNKLTSHLDEVEQWMEDQWSVNPVFVAFSPSSMCNHKCTFCVYHYKEFKPIYFPRERYLSLVDEWSNLGIKSIFFAGDGEPLMNKDCIEMIEYTKQNKIDVAMNTNARLINETKAESLAKNLSWIRISLNAGTPTNYKNIHRTSENDFFKVLENLKLLVKYKRKYQEENPDFVIGVQCLLLQENFHEIRDLAGQLKEIGVDYLAVKPFLKHPLITFDSELKENKDDVLKELAKAESLNSDNFKFVLRENNFKESSGKREYKRCLSGPFMLELDAKGNLYTCGPYIENEDHCYGNILNKSFKEVWDSERRKEVTKNIQENLDVKNCMPYCRPDSVNKFLWEIKNPPMHVNFI